MWKQTTIIKYLLDNGWEQEKDQFQSQYGKEWFDLNGALQIEYMLKGREYVDKKIGEVNSE